MFIEQIKSNIIDINNTEYYYIIRNLFTITLHQLSNCQTVNLYLNTIIYHTTKAYLYHVY